jgi:cytidine deaminase
MFQAIEASRRAMSYRNFNVGCAVFAHRGNAEQPWGIFAGANVKVEQDSRPMCAEMTAIFAAYHALYEIIVGIAVFGSPQEDHASGLHPKHLHPCGECRKVMQRLSIVKPDTRILSVKAGFVGRDPAPMTKWAMTVVQGISTEEMTFAELLDMHNDNGQSAT